LYIIYIVQIKVKPNRVTFCGLFIYSIVKGFLCHSIAGHTAAQFECAAVGLFRIQNRLSGVPDKGEIFERVPEKECPEAGAQLF